MVTAATAATAANGSRDEEATVSFGRDQLKAFIERIERLEEEKRTIADDIKDVYAEAKGNGFDVKIMRKVISLRRQDLNKRREEEEVRDQNGAGFAQPLLGRQLQDVLAGGHGRITEIPDV